MAVKLRLARSGAKKNPFYRIVATDTRSPRDGRFIERLGYYDPKKKSSAVSIKVNHERLDYWLSVGATPSERVAKILRTAKKEAEVTQ